MHERSRGAAREGAGPRRPGRRPGRAVGGRRPDHLRAARRRPRRPHRRRAGSLPGLVDAHCHVGLDAPRRRSTTTSPRSRRSPTATRAPCCCGTPARPPTPAGSTTARTCRRSSGPAGTSPAPAATSATTPTRSSRTTWSPTSRQEARRGDGWVKLVGDWIDRDSGRPRAPAGRAARVEAAIAEAHRLGARVTAHCFAEDSLRDLVEAGIDCVEHATGLTEDTIPLFAERGVAIVPTLVNIATFPQLAAGGEAKFPRWSAHMRRLHARRYDTVRAAYDAGIPVFVGTDAGGSLAARPGRPTRSPNWSRPGIPPRRGAVGGDLGRPDVARPPGPGGGRPGRPRGLRRGPARGRTGAGGAAPGGAERASWLSVGPARRRRRGVPRVTAREQPVPRDSNGVHWITAEGVEESRGSLTIPVFVRTFLPGPSHVFVGVPPPCTASTSACPHAVAAVVAAATALAAGPAALAGAGPRTPPRGTAVRAPSCCAPGSTCPCSTRPWTSRSPSSLNEVQAPQSAEKTALTADPRRRRRRQALQRAARRRRHRRGDRRRRHGRGRTPTSPHARLHVPGLPLLSLIEVEAGHLEGGLRGRARPAASVQPARPRSRSSARRSR